MIGAGDIHFDVPARADVAELRQPGVEQRLGAFIVLHGEAVDGSRAIIDVEVHGEVLARLTVGVADAFHISNAYLVQPNPAFNSIQIRIGFGRFTRPR